MSNFIKLRLILQEAKPDLGTFLNEMDKESLKKGDLDLLLRKVVQQKPPYFSEFCGALLRKGADINFCDSKEHVSNLMLACEKGTCGMVEALLRFQQLNLQQVDARQLHAGFYAVQNKSKEQSEGILKLLLYREPSLVNKQAGNQTLLIAAIRKGKIELVKLLLQAGADPNWQVPDTGNTSLHDAVKQLKSKLSKAMSEIIKLLLLKGGDSQKKNKQQKTVYDYAEKALADYQKIQEYVKQQLQLEQQKVIILYQLNNEIELRSLLQSAHMLFEQYEQQSQQDDPFLSESDIHLNVTQEILAFQKECHLEYEAAQRDLNNFINKLQKYLQPDGLSVEVYGSFATGLWVSSSKIDLQIIRKDYDNQFSPKQILEKVHNILKRANICKNVTTFTRNQRVGVVRLELSDARWTRIVHITVADRNQTTKSVVNFICEQSALYSQLRPMFFVIKTLSYHFRLNEPKNGGIKTYALVIMLLSCISKWNRSDLGKLLVDFLFYFGFYYDYLYEKKGDLVDPLEDYSVAIQIVDPLTNNDLARNMRASDLQRMFRSAYIALHTNLGSNSTLKMMFDLKKIIL